MRQTALERGIGCAAVLPAALIGFAGLTDGIGPTGWRGFAEFFGWVAVCVAVSWPCFKLLAGRGKVWRYLLVISIAAGLAYLLNWLGLGAPMTAKILFTSTLQIVGVLAFFIALGLIAYFKWSDRRSR